MLTLLAKAALYRPDSDVERLPQLPEYTQRSLHSITPVHCRNYNNLVNWQPGHKQHIHPNYIQTLTLPMQLQMMTTSPFPFRALGLVHIANRINVFKLPKYNDTLELNTYFGQVFAHKRGFVFEMHSDASKSGTVALKATSYYLARSASDAQCYGLPEFTESMLLNACSAEALQPEPAVSSKKLSTLNFSKNIGRQYARVSGDYNPIHLWPLTSRLFGFKKAIAHGMYSHALAVSAINQARAIDLSAKVSIRAMFKQAILLPQAADCVIKPCGEHSLGFRLFSEDQAHPQKVRQHLNGCVTPLKV
jgi:hypothetical protein